MKMTVILRSLLIALGLSLAAALDASTADEPRPRETNAYPSPAADGAAVPNPPDPRWLKRHEEFVELARGGAVDVLFLGDSITDLWRYETESGIPRGKAVWDRMIAPLRAANFGIDGDRTQNVLWRIQHGEVDGIHPKVVVLLIGTNNTGRERDGRIRNTVAEAISGITAVVKELRKRLPDSTILLLALFPRGPRDGPAQRQVEAVNAGIAPLEDGIHIRYLDLAPKFLGADGEIPLSVMPDRLHPSQRGYQIWADAILGPIRELLK